MGSRIGFGLMMRQIRIQVTEDCPGFLYTSMTPRKECHLAKSCHPSLFFSIWPSVDRNISSSIKNIIGPHRDLTFLIRPESL